MSTFNTPIDWATCSAERQAELLMRPAIAASDTRKPWRRDQSKSSAA